MANFRQIHVSIWKDEWFLDLEPEEKLLFVYLFSNASTSLAGIYKLALKVICFETGLSTAYVTDTLVKFSLADKVYYEDGIVWINNMRKYHETKSPKVRNRIVSDVLLIPDRPIKIRYLERNIPYGYPIDTSPQLKEDKDKKEDEDEADPVGVVFACYQNNINAGMGYHEQQVIQEWIDTYPTGWITSAINIAVENNKRKISYIKGILRNYQEAGHIITYKKKQESEALAGYSSGETEK